MDIRIRAASPADARPMARVHVDTYWTAYTGIMPAKYLADLSYRDTESWWERVFSTYYPATSTFLAETSGGEVVGFARGGPDREGDRTYRGELYTVYLLEAYQHRGDRTPSRLGGGAAPSGQRTELHARVGAEAQSSGPPVL